MGGEKRSMKPSSWRRGGSPPRGRGKDDEHDDLDELLGITPAWAGKSTVRDQRVSVQEDHPRVGGEKSVTVILRVLTEGSPPRGRGKVCQHLPQRARSRITPAWAGKRRRRSSRSTSARDHPRVGGEKSAVSVVTVTEIGSPPRGRGKERLHEGAGAQEGITPAWAGKRHRDLGRDHVREDHPRVGGEKTKKIP